MRKVFADTGSVIPSSAEKGQSKKPDFSGGNGFAGKGSAFSSTGSVIPGSDEGQGAPGGPKNVKLNTGGRMKETSFK